MGKIRLLLVILFLVSIIQAGLILHLLNSSGDISELKVDIQNTVLITIFIQFVIVIILIFNLPAFLHKDLTEIHNILKDISQGIYNIDIDLESFRKSADKDFYAVIVAIRDMLRSVLNFDRLKKEKIVEHHNRIQAIMNLTEDGFIAVDMKGNIIYINDKVIEAFPAISEKANMIDTNFPPEIENNIKKYILNILKSKTKQQTQQYFMPSMKRHLMLNSAIVRDSNGQPAGAVIAFTNLTRKKKEAE